MLVCQKGLLGLVKQLLRDQYTGYGVVVALDACLLVEWPCSL